VIFYKICQMCNKVYESEEDLEADYKKHLRQAVRDFKDLEVRSDAEDTSFVVCPRCYDYEPLEEAEEDD